MGFMDDLKDALARGKEAADNYRERELAAEEGEGAAAPDTLSSQPKSGSPLAQQTRTEADPNAPFGFVVKNEDPILVPDPVTGGEVKFNLLANGRAQMTDPSQYEGQDYKAVLQQTVLETVTAQLNDRNFMPNPNDLKTIMMASNRMVPIVTDALSQKGFKVMFKMLNVTKAV
ncbi:hypothetical protein SAMN02910456_01685 [Ruminococcaceae bacterium YRB3002]|nr:hypothetical protein SAMN02910456_01685 [Ruminococcaceae bacterium YRB3002]